MAKNFAFGFTWSSFEELELYSYGPGLFKELLKINVSRFVWPKVEISLFDDSPF